MVEELRQLTPFDPEHLAEENILVFPMAALTWISMQGAGRTVANCTPAGQSTCIMQCQQEPAWISESLRQARSDSVLVSSESPDVATGTALVGFSVTRT
jgi:hypothetical protein